MDHLPSKVQKLLLADIRAPEQLKLSQLLNRDWYRGVVLLGSDMAALALSWYLAGHLNQFYSPMPSQLNWGTWLGLPGLFWAFTGVTLLVFLRSGLYHSPTPWKNVAQAGQRISLIYLFSLITQYFYDPKLDPPRSLIVSAWFSSVALIVGFRLILTIVLEQLTFLEPQIKVFIVADPERFPKLNQVLQRRTSHYQVVGYASALTTPAPTVFQEILRSQAQEVLLDSPPDSDLASALYWHLRRSGITLHLLPSSFGLLHRRGIPEVLAGLPTLRVQPPFLGGLDYRLKRWLDFFGAFLGVLILSPLMMGVAIAIKLSSPGAVLFCQERVGLHGKPFQMFKFRTMTADAPQLQAALEAHNETCDGIMFKIKQDPRITRLGQWLRQTSIDEFPQLFNVLLGQMSLVGPRPLPVRDVARFQPWHHARHQVLPGVTGLWQISGRSEIDDFNDAVRLDLYYIDNWSLNLDLEILIETARIILFGKGAY